MTKNLLFYCAFFSMSLAFAQMPGVYSIDADGKLYFSSANIERSSDENQEPLALVGLALDWDLEDFDISNNPTLDSWDPRMDVHESGNAYVVYSDNYSNGLQKIMFRKKIGNDEWTTPIFIDKGGEIGARNNHYGAIAVSPNGDLHATYNVWAYENVRNYVGYSYYNAATDIWSDGVKISDENGTVNHSSGRHAIYSTADNLPVVAWGYDYRANQVNEEIYMKFFDGTSWSSDIPVSDVTDNMDAGYPFFKSIGNDKGMIIYSENTAGGVTELKYRVYDEVTHDLSPATLITDDNIGTFNYTLATSPSGEVMVLTVHKKNGPDRDVVQVYDYDGNADSFSQSSHIFEDISSSAGFKRIAMDCNSNDDCALIYTDIFAENISFVEYQKNQGFFGPPEVIVDEDPSWEEPVCKFDIHGNLHVVWNDMRFNDGQGWDEREVFYKRGVNIYIGTEEFQNNAVISLYPNPSKGSFSIETKDSFIVEIFDLLGRKILSKNISGNTEMKDILSPGTYLIHFTNENSSVVKKLLVE
ncbi:T9SS type A sorting domain-containing protein [Aequorivita capsosiphonis]|uniref:T9SS type A sorting domain-containing protein n=1 Tax=Aequorivita capsosiphonis TaxID=487317 RepID=UPI00146F9B0F|nr:T9SS type A sorting domain-containing protein [Aequorivita capsosiphonis]